MKTQKVAAILLTFLLVGGLLWAGGKKETAVDPNKTYSIKLTSADAITTIWMARMKKACEKVFITTNGKVDIQMYPSGEMLVYDAGIEAVMSNTSVIYFTDPSMFADYVPAYNTLCAPYLYSSYETVEKLMETDTVKAIHDKAAKAGLHAITTSFVVGSRNVLANKPINTVEDMKGLKIRVPGITIYTDTFGALGTNFTPMPFSEVFSAMQTGVLNAVEVTPGNAYNYKIYDALGKGKAYYSMTKHILNVVGLFTGEGFWQSLPEEYRSIIEKELRAAAHESNRAVAASDEALIQKMVADGVTLVPIDDLGPFKAKVESMCKRFEMYDQIVAKIASFK
jgi:TRAP-type C4-dicarboxylate transport system substrate-binding protein